LVILFCVAMFAGKVLAQQSSLVFREGNPNE